MVRECNRLLRRSEGPSNYDVGSARSVNLPHDSAQMERPHTNNWGATRAPPSPSGRGVLPTQAHPGPSEFGSRVQSRTGQRNRVSEPASRRFLTSGLSARPGAMFLNVFVAPPPAWGQIKACFKKSLPPAAPRAQKFQVAGAPPRDFLFGGFLFVSWAV